MSLKTTSYRRALSKCAVSIIALCAFPAMAAAQDAATDETDPGEIVVTAQKRAQSLSDVSLSVSAVSSDERHS